MNAIIRSLTHVGIQAHDGPTSKRTVILSNYIALTLMVANLVIYFLFPQNLTLKGFYEIIVSTLVFGLSIVFNRFNLRGLSLMYLCWLPPLMTTWLLILGMKETEYVTVSSYDGLRIYLLGTSCIPYLLLDTRKKFQFAAGIFPSFITILFCDYILDLAGVGAQEKGIHLEGYELTSFRTAIAFLIISGSCISLKVILERSDSFNEGLIKELKKKNRIIRKQSSNEVNQLNRKLVANLDELSKREFLLSKAQGIAKLGSWEYRTSDNSTFWSDEMYNIFGVDKNIDLSSPDLTNSLFGETAVVIDSAFSDLLSKHIPYDYTVPIKTPLGYSKWVRVFGFPLFEQDALVGANGIVHDVTLYKQSQGLLEANERRYRSLFEQASDAIMVTDLKGNFLDVNESFCRMIGYGREELLRKNIVQLIEPAQLKSDPIQVDDLMIGSQLVSERLLVHKDGSTIFVESSARRFDEHTIMAIARDITHRKRMEQEKEYARHLLNERIKELTALFKTSQVLNHENAELGQVLRELVLLLPAGWQYPEICAARIRVYDLEFGTPNFLDSPIKQRTDLSLQDVAIGFIEVVYLDERPAEYEGPFLQEERSLLESIADLLLLYLGRKQKEEALLKSEANLKATINNTEIMLWSVDRQFQLLMYNQPFFDYIKKRYKKKIKLGERVLESQSTGEEELHDRWDRYYLRALSGEIVKPEEFDLDQYFQYSLSPIIEREQIIGVSVFAENVTERKRIEEEIIRNRANLYATINNTGTMIWSIDRDFNVITCNEAFRSFVKQVYGLEIRLGDRILPDGPLNELEITLLDTWLPRYGRALSGESFKLIEEGNGKFFNISLNPMLNQGGKVIGASIFVEDITDRVLKENELVEANKKIGEMRLRALRAAMNPHFIFNAMNSIQYFITRNDRLNAINYLSTFSKLIRGILNSSIQQKISLTEELELLQYYIQIEQVRFEDKFSFELDVDKELDLDSIEIPSLLIQPYVENAILHGLYNKVGSGHLKISVKQINNQVLFEIEDDGVGREATSRIHGQNFPKHRSLAIALTEERLRLINESENISFEIQDLYNDGLPAGTRVKIWIKI